MHPKAPRLSKLALLRDLGQEEGAAHMTATACARPAGATSGIKRGYEIRRRGRFWEVLDSMGELVCMTVYKRGAKEVVRRLQGE